MFICGEVDGVHKGCVVIERSSLMELIGPDRWVAFATMDGESPLSE